MRHTATEETMEERRLERLEQVEFFMRDSCVPENARRNLSLGATHDLLTGFFQNSHWRTAWFCIRQAISYSRLWLSVSCRLFWYRRVLRLNEEQIDRRF